MNKYTYLITSNDLLRLTPICIASNNLLGFKALQEFLISKKLYKLGEPFNVAILEDIELFVYEDTRETLIRERDEARREICKQRDSGINCAETYALGRGWDCFKETQ
jgi:hypothetical protein